MERPGVREPERSIRTEIARGGPIRFDRFMELALYGPDGFFSAPPVGTDPDAAFATSPHVHGIFGTLLAAGLREIAGVLDTSPLRVVELGAGDGTLAAQLRDGLADLATEISVTERSPGAREQLRARELHVIDELPPIHGVVVANEVLDNLPFRLARGTPDGIVEVHVTATRDGLVEIAPPAEPSLVAMLPGRLEPDVEQVVPTGAFALIDELAARLRRGFAILIDYVSGSESVKVHGYRGQRIVEDVVHAPGTTDITAGVDLAAVTEHARRRGLRVVATPSQRRALLALGFDAWVRKQLATQQAQLDRRAGLDAVRTWSARSRATLLVDPAGLGRLRWIVLAADGDGAPLRTPDWVSRAVTSERD